MAWLTISDSTPGVRRLMPVLFLALGIIVFSSLQAPEATSVELERVSRLVQRIDRYNGLFQSRDYDDAYEMLSQWWTEDPEDRREWNRATRRMDNGIKILGWEVKRIRIAENRAKVRVATRGKTRETLFRWKEFVEEEDDFWIFENDDWYYIPLMIRDWDGSQAVEVPVPEQPMKINIKEKD